MPSFGRHHFNQIINQLINQKTLLHERAVVVVVMQGFNTVCFTLMVKLR
jgi:hypothetical protein